jgi:hypothetical protein
LRETKQPRRFEMDFYFERKTLKGLNGQIKRIGLESLQLETFPVNESSVDFDWWLDSENTIGASAVFTRTKLGFEVFVSKYTKKDLENML